MIISIHAPHRGSDRDYPLTMLPIRDFNPRSPWGSDADEIRCRAGVPLFQSTLPTGGATRHSRHFPQGTVISIHAPRGGSDEPRRIRFYFAGISIHAPRGGSDLPAVLVLVCGRLFQSTLPVGGATRIIQMPGSIEQISIHAPRGGSDRLGASHQCTCWISIHAPRGGSDHRPGKARQKNGQFQSTLPVGGAT